MGVVVEFLRSEADLRIALSGRRADLALGIMDGAAAVLVRDHVCVAPPDHVILIPRGTLAVARTYGTFRGWLATLTPNPWETSSPDTTVFGMSPLLMQAAVSLGRSGSTGRVRGHVEAVMRDELEADADERFRLTLPLGTSARRAALRRLMDNGSDGSRPRRYTSDAARRTAFTAATGMSPDRWHRRARILLGITLMADGASVRDTAAALGFCSPSAFTHAFGRTVGATPSAFMDLR